VTVRRSRELTGCVWDARAFRRHESLILRDEGMFSLQKFRIEGHDQIVKVTNTVEERKKRDCGAKPSYKAETTTASDARRPPRGKKD